MLRQKIFCTFLWFNLPILVFISLVAFLVSHIIRDHDKIYTLEQFSTVMRTIVNQEGMQALDSLRFHDDGFRITIIDITGQVLFDTERNPSLLENHIGRQEVIEAVQTGKGSSQRYSSTLEQQTYYQAVRLENGDILRISFVTETLLTYTLRMAAYFIVLLILIVFASSFIARRLSKYLMEPFDQIDLNQPLSFNTYEELIPFLNRINEQQTKIDEQIAELNRKNNELQVIIKSMSDGLILLNAQGTILTINKIARKIFGVTKENCINQNYLSIDHSQYMQDLMTNQSQQAKQTLQITKDGRDYEIRFNRIEVEKKCLGFAMMILDVTDKVRSEQMRQEFTANVSHELKTPLQSIIGYSELMANGLVRSDDIKPFAERIHKQSTRLQNLIEDIILLSSLDEGCSALTEPVSLQQITTEVFDNLQEKAKENHITLNIEGKDIMFVAVNRYIYELVYNLVDNAIRYNKPYGSVKVSLKTYNNKYQLEVIDTGIGVSPAEQYRIFERFYRVDKSHSRKTGGTGLGLSIVKRVVMFHQGKIKVQSTLGEGTSITVTFNKEKLEQVVVDNQLKQQQQLKDLQHSAVLSTDTNGAEPATGTANGLDGAAVDSASTGNASADWAANPAAQADHDGHDGQTGQTGQDLSASASDQSVTAPAPQAPSQLTAEDNGGADLMDGAAQAQSATESGLVNALSNESRPLDGTHHDGSHHDGAHHDGSSSEGTEQQQPTSGFVEELDFSEGIDPTATDGTPDSDQSSSNTSEDSAIIRRPAPVTDFSYVFDKGDGEETEAAAEVPAAEPAAEVDATPVKLETAPTKKAEKANGVRTLDAVSHDLDSSDHVESGHTAPAKTKRMGTRKAAPKTKQPAADKAPAKTKSLTKTKTSKQAKARGQAKETTHDKVLKQHQHTVPHSHSHQGSSDGAH